ncbi:MAG: UDP-3-O-[3-hydroxymyristoyl] N-acetylglucosamine deacetylase [Rhodobiaceae bacterium]|nr:UDP-3-O-[3-hydroxymyristoyl] N-acetylglucosamine deacetylase [Rhodobiaceae bacterium]
MFNMQTTIKDDIKFVGIGVHTNTKSSMILKPSDPGSGISFKRTDIKDPSKNTIKANYKNVKSTYYCTEISNEFDVSVLTIEHLLAAIFGANIDNVEILIDGPEVPILDGSSKIFMDGIQDNEIINQGKSKKFIKILEPIVVNHNSAFASFTPNDKLIVDAQIDFKHQLIGKQKMEIEINYDNFLNEISNARTFGFLEHAEKLHSMGYGLGVTLSNTIVLTDKNIMNSSGLNSIDEFVRHKILDICGDLMLADYRIIGKFTSICGGHNINYLALKELFENKNSWRLIDFEEDIKSPENSEHIEQQKLVNQ